MNWLIENVWQITAVVTAIVGNVIAGVVGWVKLNSKVDKNTLAITDLKDEVETDQRKNLENTQAMREEISQDIDRVRQQVLAQKDDVNQQFSKLNDTQVQILKELSGLNATVQILIKDKVK
jgi:glutaredoxin 2